MLNSQCLIKWAEFQFLNQFLRLHRKVNLSDFFRFQRKYRLNSRLRWRFSYTDWMIPSKAWQKAPMKVLRFDGTLCCPRTPQTRILSNHWASIPITHKPRKTHEMGEMIPVTGVQAIDSTGYELSDLDDIEIFLERPSFGKGYCL